MIGPGTNASNSTDDARQRHRHDREECPGKPGLLPRQARLRRRLRIRRAYLLCRPVLRRGHAPSDLRRQGAAPAGPRRRLDLRRRCRRAPWRAGKARCEGPQGTDGLRLWSARLRRCRLGRQHDLLRHGIEEEPMKIAAVRLFVEDVAAARAFYADLLALPPLSLEPTVLVFDAGPLLIVEQADAEARAEGLAGRFAGVSLGVSDIEALQARLKTSGCPTVRDPERESWGGTLMHVKDPGGNIVSFVQN